jgi:hypothetical protein
VALASLALIGMGEPAGPRTLHVSTTGSNTNPGTPTAPLKTIQKAVDLALAGDSIVVHAGTYPEVVQIWKSGAYSQRIRLTSAGDGEVVVKPTLAPRSCTESSPTRDRAIQLLNGADYWTIRGLTIVGGVLVSGGNITKLTDTAVRNRSLPGRGSYDPTAAATLLEKLGVNGADYNRIMENKITGRGIFTVAARYTRIRFNEVHDVDCGTGAGIWVNGFSDFSRIADNYVHDIPESYEHFMSEGIRQGRGSSYNVVENNLVEDLGGEGRGVTVDTYSGWNTMRFNTIRRADQGLNEQSAGWGNQWLNNRMEDNRRFGFNIDGKDGALLSPDDGVPAKLVVRCNVSTGSGNEELHIGAIQQSAFATNSFPTAWVSPRAADYWARVGNTWDGASTPPSETPPAKSCI